MRFLGGGTLGLSQVSPEQTDSKSHQWEGNGTNDQYLVSLLLPGP